MAIGGISGGAMGPVRSLSPVSALRAELPFALSTAEVTIGPGLSPAERRAAAMLYWQAFGGKLGRVMGPERKALRFVERVISPVHVFAARDQETGRLLGVIGFRTAGGSFVGGTSADLVAVYGRFGGGWRRQMLGLLADALPEDTLAVDGLAVAWEARGRGIGRALIARLETEARGRGYVRLRLDVAEQNPRARALYERLGFSVVRSGGSRLGGALFGLRKVYTMERAL